MSIWAQEEGLASYYHDRFHGRKSASGKIHDQNELTAAHKTYPFGTYLLVTNLSNMKRVVVCVTDRGPRKKKRIIDLSQQAAKILDFIKQGVTRVRIEVVPCAMDLHTLDLIYPRFPYFETETLRIKPPLKIK